MFANEHVSDFCTHSRSSKSSESVSTRVESHKYVQSHLETSNQTIFVIGQNSLLFLCESNQVVFSYFQTLSLAFNFCLCHDLVTTLKNPFYPGQRRLKIYFLGSIFTAFVLSIVSRKNLGSKLVST